MIDLCVRQYCGGDDTKYRFNFDSEGTLHYRDYFAVFVLGDRAMGRCDFSCSCVSDQIEFPTCLAEVSSVPVPTIGPTVSRSIVPSLISPQ